eukprot:TRINITY_DN80_c0_g4_i2.p1 TRINITY_DN80_c0_g4~~TRINITY_DN80_c0_g4_i2.p1  ORF type:complete len:393 (-),score=94.05 TRINITY_DN80_c0_g4_i2:117-1295(-)
MELEYSMIKLPHEGWVKVIREQQKRLEKELGQLYTTLYDLSKKKDMSREEIAKAMDPVIHRMTLLKKKIESNWKEADEYMTRCQMRVEHLAEAPTISMLQNSRALPEQEQETVRRWTQKRVDRIVVDQLLRSGMYDSATQLAKESNIWELVDADIFLASRKIVDSLRKRDCSDALAWCNENKAKLKKNKSTLEFQLRLQEFIELVRSERLVEAITYARKHLQPNADTNIKELQQAMTLLAFLKDTTCPVYKKYFDPNRWEDLVQQFQKDNHMLHNLTTESVMALTLQAGISAMKTPFCYNTEHKNRNCPVCQPPLDKLAEQLPFAHLAHSSIVCRISGNIMDEDNPPMMLPNGYVYSRESLQEMASKNGDMVVCPRTGFTCKFSELKKLFIS